MTDGLKTFYVNVSNNQIIDIDNIIFKNNNGFLLFNNTQDFDETLIKIIKNNGKELASLNSIQEIKSKLINIIKNWYYRKYRKIIDNCLLTKILNQIELYKQEDFMFIRLMNEEEYKKLKNVNNTLSEIKKQNK